MYLGVQPKRTTLYTRLVRTYIYQEFRTLLLSRDVCIVVVFYLFRLSKYFSDISIFVRSIQPYVRLSLGMFLVWS